MFIRVSGSSNRHIHLISPITHTKMRKRNGLMIDDHLKVVGLDNVYAIGDTTISKYGRVIFRYKNPPDTF